MTTYNTTGTITATNGSTAIVGAGTNWAAAGIVAGSIYIAGAVYPIDEVLSDTSLTLLIPYEGTTGSGKAYAIGVETAILAATTANANRLAEILDGLSPLAGFSTFSTGLMANANAAAWRGVSGLALGSIATQNASGVNISGGTLTGVTGTFSGGLQAGTVPAAPSGSIGLAITYSGIHNINLFGALRGSGNTMLGFATKPSTTVSNGFDSAAGNASWARGALVLSNSLEFLNAASATVVVGSPVTMVSRFSISAAGAVTIPGSLSKGSGSFLINHPLPELAETHDLVHSFVEAPTADLIYRGSALLVAGVASVNIDAAAGMTEGTFTALNGNLQVWLQNNTGWSPVRGDVTGNILTITAQDPACTDEISWLVVGERQDQHMLDTAWTDEFGRVTLEPLKPIPEPVPEPPEPEPIEEAE